MNIRKSFAVLSYVFRMSATKSLRKNCERITKETYDRLESYERATNSLRNYS